MRPPESFIGQPIRSLQTMLRIIAEQNPSYLPVIPDGIYGPETIQAVTVFQRKHAMPVTGIADKNTWDAIVLAYDAALPLLDAAEPMEVVWNPNQIVRKGEFHPNLYLAQGMLFVLSELYHSIGQPSVSGVLDECTEDSLSSFQMLSGLPVTGQLDTVTWKHLTAQYPLAANLQTNSKANNISDL